jgi:hypothetical protein
MNKVVVLRCIHGLFALYFTFCLVYIYYSAIFGVINLFTFIAVISLLAEGIAVFVLNKGDCPLIHIQRKIGDDTPFFRLFLPEKWAKQAVPFLAKAAWVGLGLLLLRLLVK